MDGGAWWATVTGSIRKESDTTERRHLNALVCFFVLVAQFRPTLCNPMNCSLTGNSIHGIFQARILEGVAISFFFLMAE